MSLVDIFHNLDGITEQGRKIVPQVVMGIADFKNHVLSSPPSLPPLPNLDIWPAYVVMGAILGAIGMLGYASSLNRITGPENLLYPLHTQRVAAILGGSTTGGIIGAATYALTHG